MYLTTSNDTHEIVVPKPKPSSVDIVAMCSEYFDFYAPTYDAFDSEVTKRRRYCATINQLIASDVTSLGPLKSLLGMACGTGRREIEIRQLSGLSYDIIGCEASAGMCEQAKRAGIKVHHASWPEEFPGTECFDACTYLAAFGHLPSRHLREIALAKIHKRLRNGGYLYLDVMNMDDEQEWGPQIAAIYDRESLGNHGYEKGDLFYKIKGSSFLSYFHYFTESEISSLLTSSGFEIRQVLRIGYGARFGEIISTPSEGSIFIMAYKP
jgi:SAM-dependent methyltransferase